MSDDFLGDRRKALEEAFFQKRNQQLLEQLRSDITLETQKKALSVASGIVNPAVLSALLHAGLSSETIAAVSLIPLVEVAWADGTLDDREKAAILSAADLASIAKGTSPYQLLEGWLKEKPGLELRAAWREYIAALAPNLDPAAKASLKEVALGRARVVAEASGGFLGLGNKINPAEQAVLKELEAAFG